MKKEDFVWENCYYDHDRECQVWFGDYLLKNKPIYHYYYFYDIGDEHTFHSPIHVGNDEKIKSEKQLKKIAKKQNIPIVEIDRIITEGHEIASLVSPQFVKKVINLIQAGDFEYVEDSESVKNIEGVRENEDK